MRAQHRRLPWSRTALRQPCPLPQGIDPKYIEDIEHNVLDSGEATTFDDIAGLLPAKSIICEYSVCRLHFSVRCAANC